MDAPPLSGKLTSLAGRYAKTLFDLALETKETARVLAQLSGLCNLIKSNDILKTFILSPALSRQEHIAVFNELAKKLELSDIVTRFINILAENRRLDRVFEIQEILQELVNHHNNLTHAEITSAVPLTQQQQKEISAILAKRTSGKLNINYTVDQSCLSGILVRLGNQIIDLTLANQLNHLANAMKGSA